jgi:hypothetical protein
MNGKQLKHWRITKKKVTQATAATLFNVTASQYRRWELGNAPVPFLVGENIRLMEEVKALNARIESLPDQDMDHIGITTERASLPL